jgi:hypothetical protein
MFVVINVGFPLRARPIAVRPVKLIRSPTDART